MFKPFLKPNRNRIIVSTREDRVKYINDIINILLVKNIYTDDIKIITGKNGEHRYLYRLNFVLIDDMTRVWHFENEEALDEAYEKLFDDYGEQFET